MGKKKVIVAFVVFLVIAFGVLVFSIRNCYSSKAVLAEVCKNAMYVDQLIPVHRSHRSFKSASPSLIEKVTSWYNYNFSSYRYNQIKPIDPHEPIILFHGNNTVIVKLTIKMGLVSSVEIRDLSGASESALELKSRLADAFPNLPCTIIGYEKPDVSE